MNFNRRRFLSSTAALTTGAFFTACSESTNGPEVTAEDGANFDISLAQWSNHVALKAGELDNLDWPAFTKENFDISALEWVNQFFGERKGPRGMQPKSADYIKEMKKRCDDIGTKSVLIMCDGVGSLGDPDAKKRTNTVEGHYAWLDVAKELGCHSIRVNSASNPELSPEKQADLCADGLRRLSEHAATMGLNVIVENHGGMSSNGAWLAGVLRSVNLDNCGSLPDYGNFYVVKNRGDAAKYEAQKALYAGDPALTENEFGLAYDRYRGVKELMPFAKGVSAKAHDFNADGDEIHTDFTKMMQIVKNAGYEGYIGIEYEGKELSEVEGIKKTKALLEKVIATA
ncbi:MAG: sugar phosphate isomerase/epimerase [Verrucomicrobiales bacterium]|nr:sugar phosphate isomerase/epimerase [Verrucomicrobiales bacterium]